MHQPVIVERSTEQVSAVLCAMGRLLASRGCWEVRCYTSETPSGTCQKRGCGSPAVARVWLNIWGVVLEFESCREHQSRHGAWADGF